MSSLLRDTGVNGEVVRADRIRLHGLLTQRLAPPTSDVVHTASICIVGRQALLAVALHAVRSVVARTLEVGVARLRRHAPVGHAVSPLAGRVVKPAAHGYIVALSPVVRRLAHALAIAPAAASSFSRTRVLVIAVAVFETVAAVAVNPCSIEATMGRGILLALAPLDADREGLAEAVLASGAVLSEVDVLELTRATPRAQELLLAESDLRHTAVRPGMLIALRAGDRLLL